MFAVSRPGTLVRAASRRFVATLGVKLKVRVARVAVNADQSTVFGADIVTIAWGKAVRRKWRVVSWTALGKEMGRRAELNCLDHRPAVRAARPFESASRSMNGRSIHPAGTAPP